MAAVWRGLADHEFFGPRVQHIYFYGAVDDKSVQELRKKVLAACNVVVADPGDPDPDQVGDGKTRTMQTGKGTRTQGTQGVQGKRNGKEVKPIVLHVHSHGGSVYSSQWLLSMFNQVSVPLCAMVDAVSASAATAITVMAPYRVATAHSLSLIHDYGGGISGKREALLEDVERMEAVRRSYFDLYKARTRISRPQLEEILRRDMWLDAATSLRLGLYDRVIRPDRRALVARFPSRVSPDPSMSHIFAACKSSFHESFDQLLASLALQGEEKRKPIVLITPGGSACDKNDPRVSLAIIARVRSSPVPVIGVIDNVVSWWQALPVLFCARRFMYENATLEADMLYEPAWGVRVPDIVHNVGVFRGLITRAIKERAFPSALSSPLLSFDRPTTLSADDCLKLGLIDEVVRLSAKSASGRRSLKSRALYS